MITVMDNLSLKIFYAAFLTFSLFLIMSCNEDVPVTPEPEGNDSVFSVNGVYVVCSGGGLSYYRELSYYDFDKNEYKENIYKNGFDYLPVLPTSVTYGNGFLFISNYWGSILKLSLLGDSIGVASGAFTSFIYGYDNRLFVSYFQSISTGSFAIRDQSDILTQHRVFSEPGYVSGVTYNGQFLYFTRSQCTVSNDSTLVKYDQESGIVESIPLSRWAAGITISNSGNVIVGCKDPGNLIFKINADNLQILESVRVPDGFKGNLCSDNTRPEVFFISGNDKIIKYNHSTGVFSDFILNSSQPQYYISAYLYDNTLKKHFAVFTGNQPNMKGLLKIYNFSGILERTYTTGVNPVGIVAAKYSYHGN
jgi:hypothetical protein